MCEVPRDGHVKIRKIVWRRSEGTRGKRDQIEKERKPVSSCYWGYLRLTFTVASIRRGEGPNVAKSPKTEKRPRNKEAL